MLKDVQYCGVAFTVDPSTLGNYYVINYDETGSTSAITSGNGKESKLLYIFKGMDRKKTDGFVCHTRRIRAAFWEE